MAWLRLSYDVVTNMPVWPGTPNLEFEADSEIAEGSSSVCFVYRFCMSNHAGTHVDGPKHFNGAGKSVSAFEAGHYVFDSPVLVSLEKEPDALITESDLLGFKEDLEDADLLLLRTGFGEKYRLADPEFYVTHNPGLSAGAAHLLMNRYPRLRAIAVDMVSVSGYQHKREGTLTHQLLCGMDRQDERAIMLIEDVDLSAPELQGGALEQVILAPLFLPELDSSPCTLFAKVV